MHTKSLRPAAKSVCGRAEGCMGFLAGMEDYFNFARASAMRVMALRMLSWLVA